MNLLIYLKNQPNGIFTYKNIEMDVLHIILSYCKYERQLRQHLVSPVSLYG